MRSGMVFDRYLFRALLTAMVIIAFTLAGIVLLTQSLRFLELVVQSGASSLSFWILTMLVLPRFLESILPIALMIATLFIYNKMIADSEIAVLRASGFSPFALSRPALMLASVTCAGLLFVTTWLAPTCLSSMHKMRQVIKAQYSTALFREQIFNAVGKDITVYIHSRNESGELEGLVIHDSRKELEYPLTIVAQKGVVVETDSGKQVVVFDGSRQDYNTETKTLNRLDFNRYTVDLPVSGPVRQRWREPEERTFFELLSTDLDNQRDAENTYNFYIEAHKRIVSPFLAFTFVCIPLVFLLLGPIDRKGMGWRILHASVIAIAIQGLYLGAYNLAANSISGLVLMYILTFLPIAFCLFLMSPSAESLRAKILYNWQEESKNI